MWEMLRDTMTPFLWGGALALVLDIPRKHLENHLQWMKPKLRRTVALSGISLLLVGLIFLSGWLLIPRVMSAVEGISGNLEQVEQELGSMLGSSGAAMLRHAGQMTGEDMRPLVEGGVQMAQNVAHTMMDMGFGLVLALYLLASRESTMRRAKQFCLAAFGTQRTQRIQRIAQQSAQVFSSFVVGQCLEAVILTGMFLAVLLVLGFPYALGISLLIGITALIPVFGAWIGGAAGTLLTLSAGTKTALGFLIVFLVVQEVENQLIYPRVVGNRVGLPPMWVLAGVLLGGGLLGPAGVFLGIPLIGVIYDQSRRWVHLRLDKPKKM